MTRVLVTGGSGFIAAHIVQQLLEQGHSVVTTVRSEDKAQKLRDAHKDRLDRLEVSIVPDIAKERAFDEVAKTPGLEVVMHTASPFHYNWTDPKMELIDPALNGTDSVLRAVKDFAPGVRRLIVTSSFAAILDEQRFEDPTHTFDETSWNPSTLADIHGSKPTAYRVSKTLAERRAWEYVAGQTVNFDLVTICPPLVLGPVVHHLASLESMNTSNERVVAMLQGKWKDAIADMGPVALWVDVRDVAEAHVRAMDNKSAGGQRLFTTAGLFDHRQLVDFVRANYPEFAGRLPDPGVPGGMRPAEDKTFRYSNEATTRLLGIKWRSLDESIGALVESLKAHGI